MAEEITRLAIQRTAKGVENLWADAAAGVVHQPIDRVCRDAGLFGDGVRGNPFGDSIGKVMPECHSAVCHFHGSSLVILKRDIWCAQALWCMHAGYGSAVAYALK